MRKRNWEEFGARSFTSHSLSPFFTITNNNMLPTTPPSPVCVLFSNFQNKTVVFLVYCICVLYPKYSLIITDNHRINITHTYHNTHLLRTRLD